MKSFKVIQPEKAPEHCIVVSEKDVIHVSKDKELCEKIANSFNNYDQLKDINRELLEALTECLGEWGRKFPGLKEEPWLDTQFQNLTQLVTKAQSLNL